MTNKPRANRTPRIVAVPLVEMLKTKVKNHQTTIYAIGNVIPAQSVNLTPRIGGLVVSVSSNFVEGGLLKKGDLLVEFDSTDYLLAIKQSENEVAKAQYNFKLEQGRQVIVQRESQLRGSELFKHCVEMKKTN